jgi:hypothetical protein
LIKGVSKAPAPREPELVTTEHSLTLAELVDFARASGAEELQLRARGVVLTITTDAP